jgi:hypothetical protein
MYVVVKSENLNVGTIVSYDSTAEIWRTSQDGSGVIGAITQIEEDSGEYWSHVTFCGITFAIADQNIPDEGGQLRVSNGQVHSGVSTDCGIISPLPRGQESRVAGELVMIHLR